MAAGDKYLTAARRNLNKEQLFRLLCREDENGKPFLNVNAASGPVSVLQPWYDSLSVKPSEGLWTDLKIMAQTLVDTDKWNEIDLFSMLAALETDEQRLRPLKNTNTLDFSLVGGYTLNNDGFLSDGTTGYINTNWIQSTHGVKYTLNDAFTGIYRSSTGTPNRTPFGVVDTTSGNNTRFTRSSLNTFRINTTGNLLTQGAVPSFISAAKLSSTTAKTKSGTTFGSLSTVVSSAGLATIPIFIGASNNNGSPLTFSLDTLRNFVVGSSLLQSDDVLYNALNTFFASRGLTTY